MADKASVASPLADSTQPTATPPISRNRTWTLLVACCGVLVVISSMVALNTALGDIAMATSANQTQLTWIIDSYTLTLACLLLPAGAIGDRYGRRGALLFGLAVFAVASIVPALSTDPLHIIGARAVAGVGAAFIMPATLSLITASYPADQRTKAVGIWAGMAGCGGVFGMLGSGVLLHFWPWQSIFWAFAGAGLVLIVMATTITSSRDAEARTLDVAGAVVIAAAVAALVYGILAAPDRGWTHPVVLGGIAGGLILAGLFAIIELRARYPLLDVRLFLDRQFGTGAAAITVLFMVMFGFFYLAMQFMQLVMGYSPLGTALALSPLAVPMLILSPLSSWYLPKLGLRVVVLMGLGLLSAGLLSLCLVRIDSSYWALAWPLLVVSTGVGIFTAPTTSAIMTSVPDAKQGVASAVNDTTREVGAALGIALTGSLLAAGYSKHIGPAIAGFPAPMQDAARGSLAGAVAAAPHLGPIGGQLVTVARVEFLHAMQTSLVVLASITAVAGVLIAFWAPGRERTPPND
ncbi:MFS transporter [Mycolicibacterium mucogenicum]|uniref:MFS transporter n=1 Tax=Mycolicibacterium mucogenicum DSM 44124 TaxID=1226753 RepID=A0A8H2JFY2_MYCMU|nr:MFS transporter [Mycolicibacterium mucogenicum]KAB7755573.1 major facilitator transporter [Mycolicibacterium mucogenicum DSM 44124]QPG68311.1 MFS transporter [Mycolicibacterium mucogenicum DSM 44124]